jgi:hypothetical protein
LIINQQNCRLMPFPAASVATSTWQDSRNSVASLLTNAGKCLWSHFLEKAGLISIHPERAAQVRQYWRPIAASGLTSQDED